MPKTIIVGAGPAGLMAARHLEDFLVLEKEKEIGKPVQCAEAINKGALEKLGIEPDNNWISSVISQIELVVPSGQSFMPKSHRIGFILDRILFEKFLAKGFEDKIKLNTKVVEIKRKNGRWKIKTAIGEVYDCQYLIGADGPASIVRRSVFNNSPKILSTIQYLVKTERNVLSERIRIYFDNEKFPHGYAWVFPKSSHTANIGLGGMGNLKESFDYFMEKVVRKEFGNYELIKNISGAIPSGGAKMKLFKDNAFLVGDAGALADPVFDGGMRNAMFSGKIASDCILENKAHLYEKRIKSMSFLDPDLILAKKLLSSLPNSVFNALVEVVNKEGVSKVDLPKILFLALRNSKLRKNILKLSRLFFILKKSEDSFG